MLIAEVGIKIVIMDQTLINLRVKIIPDEIFSPFEGFVYIINNLDNREIIIKISNPFYHDGIKYEYILASPRHEGKAFDILLEHKEVLSSFLNIPSDKMETINPFDVNWWRGGGAFVGDVVLVEE